jgi:Uma2 family endonuclease
VYAPDASWVSRQRIDALRPDESAGFWPLSPDVVIEIRSVSDAFRAGLAKIDAFVERGSAYAVAIDPISREVVERGTPPASLVLDFDAIIDA